MRRVKSLCCSASNRNKLKFWEYFAKCGKKVIFHGKRFQKDLEFKNQYKCFMNEYEKFGHMSKIEDRNIFYLPRHGVINQASLTTRLRVVLAKAITAFHLMIF